MRLLVGLIGAVLALGLVGVLVRSQLGAAGRPSVVSPVTEGAGGATGAASAAVAPRQRAGQVADEIGRALEQGARRGAAEGEGEGGR